MVDELLDVLGARGGARDRPSQRRPARRYRGVGCQRGRAARATEGSRPLVHDAGTRHRALHGRGKGPADPGEPYGQRCQVHGQGRNHADRRASQRRGARPGERHGHWHPRHSTGTGCSSRSLSSTPGSLAVMAARGSGSTTPAASPSSSAATSTWTPPRGVGSAFTLCIPVRYMQGWGKARGRATGDGFSSPSIVVDFGHVQRPYHERVTTTATLPRSMRRTVATRRQSTSPGASTSASPSSSVDADKSVHHRCRGPGLPSKGRRRRRARRRDPTVRTSRRAARSPRIAAARRR